MDIRFFDHVSTDKIQKHHLFLNIDPVFQSENQYNLKFSPIRKGLFRPSRFA